MMRSTFVRRQLLLVVAAVLITSALTSTVYSVYARNLLAESKSKEIAATAKGVAQRVEEFYSGTRSPAAFEAELLDSLNLVGAGCAIYLYPDSVEPWIASNNLPDAMPTQEMIQQVMAGYSVDISGYSIWRSGNMMSGYPFFAWDGSPMGAVFLIKSTADLITSVNSMNTALVGIMIAAVAFMMLPTFLAAWLLARPIYQMRDVALRMAQGDFSARANENVRGEIGELGATLNYLSDRLSATITALQLEQQRLLSIVDGLGEGILAIDANGDVTHVNPALLRMFGQRDENGVIQVEPLFEDEDLWENFRMTMESRTPMVRSLHIGDAIIRVSITPLESEESLGDGAVGLFRDVTEQERLEQTRKEYVANVSHELRTPISSIRGLAEALNDGLIKEEADRQRYYGYILRESMRLGRLIEDLLELSRLQSGSVALKTQKVDLTDLMRDFYERYKQTASDVDIQLDLILPEDCPPVRTNPDRIEQVLVVLLDNAIKYTPADGRIVMDVRPAGERMLVSVRDTGSGIDPCDVDHVFDRFYKADKSHSGHGTGLGLSIAKEIMNRLGEEIYVESELGVGTAFTLSLALWTEALSPSQAESPLAEESTSSTSQRSDSTRT